MQKKMETGWKRIWVLVDSSLEPFRNSRKTTLIFSADLGISSISFEAETKVLTKYYSCKHSAFHVIFCKTTKNSVILSTTKNYAIFCCHVAINVEILGSPQTQHLRYWIKIIKTRFHCWKTTYPSKFSRKKFTVSETYHVLYGSPRALPPENVSHFHNFFGFKFKIDKQTLGRFSISSAWNRSKITLKANIS